MMPIIRLMGCVAKGPLRHTGSYFPLPSAHSAFWTVIVGLADVLLLAGWQGKLRERAARIQELFDCDVLRLPWRDVKVGSDTELVPGKRTGRHTAESREIRRHQRCIDHPSLLITLPVA